MGITSEADAMCGCLPLIIITLIVIARVWKRGWGLEVLAKASDAPDVQALAPQMHAKSCRVYPLRFKAGISKKGGGVGGLFGDPYRKISEDMGGTKFTSPIQTTQKNAILKDLQRVACGPEYPS